jgi:hypothetical protein
VSLPGAMLVPLLVLAACAPRGPAPSPAPVPPGGPGLSVTLVWTTPVDLDLYVTDPALETVYFGNPHTASGGTLERDARCADPPATEHVERARWERPPPGRYRVGVDFIERCAARDNDVPYDLVVDVEGRRIAVPGRARLGVRDPRALEFTIP